MEAQRQSLGEAKLKQLDEAMKKAHAENEKPIPDAIFATFPVPSTKSIAFIPVESAQNPPQATVTSGKLAEFLKKDGAQSQVPYFIQFDQVNSAFVDVKVLVDSRDLTPELRLYLELYLV